MMEKIVIKRENHVLEITEDSVAGWVSVNLKSGSTSTEQEDVMINRVSSGWIVSECDDLVNYGASYAINLCECIRDALSMTEMIDDRGFDELVKSKTQKGK